MYYFLHGDTKKIFQKAEAMVQVLLQKKPDAALFKVNDENYSEERIEELIGGRGLFSNKYIVVLSRLCEKKDASDYLIKKAEDIQKSENVFFWLETFEDEKQIGLIKKCANKTICLNDDLKRDTKKMNIFDLTNSFVQKDRKKTWILYQKAIQLYSPEEIYGTMWWQLKGILLAHKTRNAKEAGMKEFPYQKSKHLAKNIGESEAIDLATKLIQTYHQSRLDGEDLSLNLEKIILG